MKAYNDSLHKKWHEKILSRDGFILLIGQTNDFGLNWVKPIKWLLLFTFLFYFLLVVGISDKLSYSFNLSATAFY